MKHSIITFFVTLLSIIPLVASAEIRINEVAWVGGNGNSNCEWIELYNTDDAAVDISGWSFKINDTASSALETGFAGDLVIEPNSYYVITRKFSETAASAAICHPYFEGFTASHLGGIGPLNNTSLSITLLDETSATIDSVTNTTINWSDFSKANTGNYDTMQRSGTNWLLNTPTPAAPTTAPNPQETTIAASPTKTVHAASRDKNQIRSLSIVAPDILHVGIPFTFTSVTSPKDSRKYKSHLWNFGDFTTSKLSSPTHTYRNPGTYQVHLTIDEDIPLTLTKKITVIASTLTATRLSNGSLEITNTGNVPIDLSFFQVVGNTTFTIPEHSTILANAKIVIPTQTVEQAHGIFNPQGELIASIVVPIPDTTPPPEPLRAETYKESPKPARTNLPWTSTTTPEEELSGTSSITFLDQEFRSNENNSTTTNQFPAYAALGILLLIATAASLIKLRLQ